MNKKVIPPPVPPTGRIMVEGFFQSKKEQKLNDALFLKTLANYFEENSIYSKEVIKLKNIAKRMGLKVV